MQVSQSYGIEQNVYCGYFLRLLVFFCHCVKKNDGKILTAQMTFEKY